MRTEHAKRDAADQSSFAQPIWFVCGLFALIALLVSGFLTVTQADDRHALYTKLQELRAQQEQSLAEYSRLQIEKGSLLSYEKVEEAARTNKALDFPAELSVDEERSSDE